jgi:hypothetical protein
MNPSHPVNSQLVEAGQPVPRRIADKPPVTIPYLKALKARESLACIEAVIRRFAAEMACSETGDCVSCAIDSLADDAASIEKLLRGSS